MASEEYLIEVALRFRRQNGRHVKPVIKDLRDAVSAIFFDDIIKQHATNNRIDQKTLDTEMRCFINLREREARFYSAYKFSGAHELANKSSMLGYKPRHGESWLCKIWRERRHLPDARLAAAAAFALCDVEWLSAMNTSINDNSEMEERLLKIPPSFILAVMYADDYLPCTVTNVPGWAHPFLLAKFMNLPRQFNLRASGQPSFELLPSSLPPPPWLSLRIAKK